MGGLREDEAAAKLRSELAPRLERPVKVRVAGHRFELSAKRARVVADVEGMADYGRRAQPRQLVGRPCLEGGHGGEVKDELPAMVLYSEPAVGRFVRRIKRSVEPPAARCEGRVLRRGPARGALPDRADAGRSEAVAKARRDGAHAGRQRPHAPREGEGREARRHDGAARRQVPAGHNRRPACIQAPALQGPEAEEDLQDRRRPGWSGDTCRSLPRAEQGGEPGLARSEQRLGGQARREGDPRRRSREPAEGALAWDLRRRGDPRHRRRWPRSEPPHRTAA